LKLIGLFARAAKLAIDECQYQFRSKRWNCTVFDRPNVFGRLATVKSRETAFIYALNAAAAMYEVTRACGRGELKACSCSSSEVRRSSEAGEEAVGGRFAWGGCSDNVIFGHKMSRYFVDSNEYVVGGGSGGRSRVESVYTRKEYRLMNLHNNEVGRRVSDFSF
jgi:hypothetical protein